MTSLQVNRQDVDPGESDLRGWWGDTLANRPLGGRLWTLGRAKATDENIRRARDFAMEALAWLMSDGIAGALNVAAVRIDGDGSGATLRLDIDIVRAGATNAPTRLSFDFLWRAMA